MNRSKSKTAVQNKPLLLDIPAKWQYGLLIALVGISLAIFSPVRHFEFLNWDDDVYVTTSESIKDLSPAGIKHIFTSFSNSNYHPLTTLSYALLYDQYGLNSQAFHLLNLILHLINIVLVFGLIRLLYPQGFVALFVSSVFALHPMHLESVAWISETKDLLYTLFLLLSMHAYILYRRQRKLAWMWYVASILLFVLSCLSKSAAAILPLILLLFDWYDQRKRSSLLWIDKIPFFLISLTTGILAVMSQKAGASINMAGDFPLLYRFFFASYGFFFYILKFFFPVQLSALHYFPIHTDPLPGIYFISGLLFLTALIFIYFRIRKPISPLMRTSLFGLGFYLISLMMVLHLIPIGRAIVSERYTYLAYIGFALAVGHLISPYFSEKVKIKRFTGRLIQWGTLGFVVLMVYTSSQRLPVWRNSLSLFDDIIKKTPDRAYAYLARGNTYLNMKDTDRALADYNRAIARDPELGQAYYRRFSVYYALGRYAEAIPDIEKTVALLPHYPEGWNERGSLKYLSSMYEEALMDFKQALLLRPGFTMAHKNAALALYKLGRKSEGLIHLDKAIGSKPDFAEGYYYKGVFLWEEGDTLLACKNWHDAQILGYEAATQKIMAHCDPKTPAD